MTAISTPIPESVETPELPSITVVAPPSHNRVLVAAGVAVTVLALIAIAMWARTPQVVAPPAAVEPLEANLQWMFNATLTFPAGDREGEIQPAPFESLLVTDVAITDPVRGPLLVTVRGQRPDGSAETVVYTIDVTRTGDSWAVEARPLDPEGSEGVSRPGS